MSKEAIEHYEAALKEAFPSGATGDVFHHWNEARKALADQPAQGCEFCSHPLYAGTKCKNCGREQPAQQVGTIGHIGTGKTTLTGAIAPILAAQQQVAVTLDSFNSQLKTVLDQPGVTQAHVDHVELLDQSGSKITIKNGTFKPPQSAKPSKPFDTHAAPGQSFDTHSRTPQQEPVAWKHDCAALLQNDVELWVDRCPHCGKPRTTPQAQPAREPLTDEQKDAARWRWLSWHIKVAWNEGKFTSLVRIVSDKDREALNASIDRMMAGDWSDAEAAHGIKGDA